MLQRAGQSACRRAAAAVNRGMSAERHCTDTVQLSSNTNSTILCSTQQLTDGARAIPARSVGTGVWW